MKTRQLIPILAIALMFTACEGTTTREWVIENNSTYDLHVSSNIPISYVPINNLELTPGSQAMAGETDERGGSSQPGQPSAFINSMVITTNSGDTIMKDPLLSDNWQASTDHRRRIPSHYHHEYRFVIVDDDL